MTTETGSGRQETRKQRALQRSAESAPVYGLGFVGALIYYIQFADSFWMGALGILKAAVWPAILVYELLKSLSL